MSAPLLLCYILILCYIVNGCHWDTFSLEILANAGPITCSLDPQYGLNYTACRNQLACNGTAGEQTNGMVIQYETENDKCIAHTAEWDNGKTIPIEFINSTTGNAYKYVFNYTNGWDQNGCDQEQYGGRKTILTFRCNPNADPYSNVKCHEGTVSTNDRCTYYLDIDTKAACVTANLNNLGDDDSSGISGGWIILIIFFSCFCMYCCIGYIYNGYKNNGMNDIQGNIPQSNFWFNLPRLVKAGCGVTSEAIKVLCCINEHNRDDLLRNRTDSDSTA